MQRPLRTLHNEIFIAPPRHLYGMGLRELLISQSRVPF